MVIKLSPELFVEAGYAHLTETQAESCVRELYETLELRVGRKMARKLTPIQVSQFEKAIEQGDDSVQNWLENNANDYRQVVHDELALILQRLREALAAREAAATDTEEVE